MKIPFFLRISQITLGIIAIFFVLYIGQEVILPLIYSIILAMLLNPAVNFLEKKKINTIVAISIVLLAATIILFALIYFLYTQFTLFGDALPMLEKKFNLLINQSVDFISKNLKISPHKLNEWISKARGELTSNSSLLIGKTLSTATNIIFVVTLVPVYVFMILYYKPLLLEFIAKLSPKENHSSVKEVLIESKLLIQSYLGGLIIETVIVSILNALGLFILGVDYAIIIGIIGGLLNLIPYVGGIIAIAIPVLLALATQSPLTALLVIVIYLFIQFIDNNYILPVIVASRVRINGLFSVIVVIIGGTLWGISGMFLALPLTAIIKVIFDRIKPMEPWGFLLGDTMPEKTRNFFTIRRKRKTKKSPAKVSIN